MARYVALLRGINVGRANRVGMAALRELLESLGYRAVRTILNSGNAVFDTDTDTSPQSRPALRIQTAVREQLGVPATVIVKSAFQVAAILSGGQVLAAGRDASRLLVAMTAERRGLAALAGLAAQPGAARVLTLGAQAAYLWCPQGIARSRVAASLLQALGEAGTTRNWATMQKIQQCLAAADALG